MIYFAQLPTGAIKIGCSEDVDARLGQLEGHYRQPVALLHTMEGDRETEREIHERFSHLRFGRTEQFRPAVDLMTFIGKPLLVSQNPDAVEAIPGPPDVTTWGVRMTREYQDWLSRLASSDRCTMAGLIDRAVTQYAASIGFKDSPPERVP
jgi:Meiotically up-regulated gene 113